MLTKKPNINIETCTHIKAAGGPCNSPALRGEHLCYFHTRVIKGVASRADSIIDVDAIMETPEALQLAIMKVYNNIMRHKIDLKTGTLLIRTLRIAALNVKYVNFDKHRDQMVREIPDYDAQYLKENPEAAEVPVRVPPFGGPAGITYPETSDSQVKDFRATFARARNGSVDDMNHLINHLSSKLPKKTGLESLLDLKRTFG
jgi:hypothetical protein